MTQAGTTQNVYWPGKFLLPSARYIGENSAVHNPTLKIKRAVKMRAGDIGSVGRPHSDDDNEKALRRLAIQLAAQLPEETDNALEVLRLARELVVGFLQG